MNVLRARCRGNTIIIIFFFLGLHSHFCSGSIDIGYLLDSSGSLRNHYQNEKEILKTLATVSGISEYGPHIGVVLFSSRAFLSIALNEHLNLPSFKKAVDELPLIGTLTSIDRALEVAKNQLLDPRYGRRIDVPSVVILITDGSQSYLPKSKDPVEVARRLRDKGTTIFAVGVGDEIDMRELMLITGSERLTFKMDSFREAMSSELLRRIKTITCPQGKVIFILKSLACSFPTL